MASYAKIDKKLKEQFWTARQNSDAISKTLSKAKSYGLTELECQPIIIKRFEIEKEFQDLKNQIIEECVISNVVDFENGWYGILTYEKSKTNLMVVPLKDVEIEGLFVDFNTGMAKTRNEYSQLIANKLDNETLFTYKNQILRRQDEFLKEFFGCENEIQYEGQVYKLTSHCIRRWKERISQTESDINLDNRNQIVEEITTSFKNSKLEYIGDNCNERFFLDKNLMVFFVVSEDNVIMSLWRNTYGFPHEDIDAASTLLVLERIKQTKEKFLQYNVVCSDKIAHLKSKISDKENEINEVNDYIQNLLNKKNVMEEELADLKKQIADINEQVEKQHEQLKYEEGFLFKSHKVICDDQV